MIKFDAARLGAAFLGRRHLLVFGIPAVSGLLLLLLGGGSGLEQMLHDRRDAIRSHAASGEVRIVEIDARSLDTIGRWPLPRGVHAAAIDRLHSAGARTIAFDVDFSAISTAGEDAKLAAALDRADHSVILPTFNQLQGAGRSDSLDKVPAKIFYNKAFLAGVNVRPDADGYVREMPLGVVTLGTPRPSLASLLAERNAEIGHSFAIDYAIEPETIPRLSLLDLVEGRVPARDIAGKRFVIGMTAVENGDRYAVPRHGVIPGVVIQALGAETLMTGPIPERMGGGAAFALALLLLALAVRLKSRRARVGLILAGTFAILALPLAAEEMMALSMPIVPALLVMAAAMLLSAAAFFGQRYVDKALRDEATSLPNLAALKLAADGRTAGDIVVARIDRFDALASALGSAATTMLIQRVADRLRFSLSGRRIYLIDAASFGWIETPDESDSLEPRIEAIAALMRSPVECGRLVDVALHFGMAGGPGLWPEQLVANAGLAAVHAAQRGERWRRFLDSDAVHADWQISLLGELDTAMAAGQIWNAYQPKLDIGSGEIVAVEALVRWSHPERGAIRPDSFIPVIEEAGRIRELTAHVLHQALEDALQWDRNGFPIGVAVNVSATLLADHEFIDTVGQIIQSHTLPASRVTIEVTESAAMASPERAIAALESWRSLGVGISIDDYGTGQSSLGYLQKLPATELKIDKSFVQTIVTDSRNAIMVRSTIALAHELGMKAVAEGIEDIACLKMLAEMGCDTAQGYHIAKPMPANQLAIFLDERSRQAA